MCFVYQSNGRKSFTSIYNAIYYFTIIFIFRYFLNVIV